METIIRDTVLLFVLGITGWGIFTLLHFPAAPILGALTVIGTLRIVGYPLPPSPEYLLVIIQIMLGCFAGTKINKETVGQLKTIILPAGIIISWSLSVIFFLGILLWTTTPLDLYTSLLSSSMGGLPEMTIIALASGADVTIVVIVQTFRMITTSLIFPFIVKRSIKSHEPELERDYLKKGDNSGSFFLFLTATKDFFTLKKDAFINGLNYMIKKPWDSLCYGTQLLLTLAIASIGGLLFLQLGVPAGGMLGAMFAVGISSLAGIPIQPFPKEFFGYMLVGIGIMVSGSISPEFLEYLTGGGLLFPVLLSTIFTLLTALGVATIIHKVVGWDYPTCFLAAAPGGFTVMTALAVKYGQDSFRVSLLHLCRLIAIKTVVPIVFMFLL